ncbi:hypothetical protein ABK040_005435 [Willaertia magna]
MQSLEINLKRPDRTYYSGEKVRGTVKINAKQGGFKSNGINLSVEGIVSFQYNGTSNVSIFEAVMNNFKPIKLIDLQIPLDKSGTKFPSGTTDIPFEFILQPLNKKIPLYETYHGVYLSIKYKIHVEVKMGMFSKDQKQTIEFMVVTRGQGVALDDYKDQPKSFTLTPSTLQNVVKHANIPEYEIKGHLNSVYCDIAKPFEGEIEVIKASSRIKSLELQLVRVETCSVNDGGSVKEATEIQNIQLGEGNVFKGLKIPIYMVFPRLFTSPTLISTNNFRIQFEMNVIAIFADGFQITENFPIILYRREDDEQKFTI